MRPHIRSLPWCVPLSALLGAAVLSPAAAPAQRPGRHSASLLATATVVATRGGAAALRGLELGRVRAGERASLGPEGRTAAAWRLSGTPNGIVVVTFDLPVVLARDGGAALPIRFGAGAGRWGGREGQAFDPGSGALARFGAESAPTLEVRLGATVAPPQNAPGGAYRGTVTLNVLYL